MKQSFSTILENLQVTLQLLKKKRLEALYRADKRYQEKRLPLLQKDVEQIEQTQIKK